MAGADPTEVLVAFQEYVSDLAKTWYAWDEAKAFRHAAFRLLGPDRSLPDERIVAITGIAANRDLDVGGGAVDEEHDTLFLMQSIGYNTKTDVERVEQFWEAPERILSSARKAGTPDEAMRALALSLQECLRTGAGIRMVFVSRGGFTSAAVEFANARSDVERTLFLPTGGQVTCLTSLELVDELQLTGEIRDDYVQ